MNISCAQSLAAPDWRRVVSRICICCGEPFAFSALEEQGNPNICVACSSMAQISEEESDRQSYGSPSVDPALKNWSVEYVPGKTMAKQGSRSISR